MNPFNDEQYQAIKLRDASILVSAPAGSGKTKILVERILSLIKEDGYFVDELLVLTFTEAAANEMKQRLALSLDKEIMQAQGDLRKHLEINKERLPMAYITNFHGFCGQLLKKYGYLIGVDPGYEVLADTHALMNKVLDDLIEQWLKDEHLASFIHLYFPEYRYDGFKEWILSMYRFYHTIHDFDTYYRKVQSIYQEMINIEDKTQWSIFPLLLERLKESAMDGYNLLQETLLFAYNMGIDAFYARPEKQGKTGAKQPIPYEALNIYYQRLFDILAYIHPNMIEECGIKVEKSYLIKYDEEITEDTKKAFNDLKSKATKTFSDTYEAIIDTNPTKAINLLKDSLEHLNFIFSPNGLLNQFSRMYKFSKQRLHYLDFNDLESEAIRLLDPKYGISEVLYHQLKEIMIDEYQDTNYIQETLILKICEYQQPFINRFIVGDMKQSIYRFRQADPELFKEKYETYALDDLSMYETKTRRIDLKYNYRSNKVVLDSINYIFDAIMDTSVGGLEYYHDPSAWLNYDYVRKEKHLKGTEEEIRLQVHERLKNDRRFETELLLVDKTSEDIRDLDSVEYEAHMIARRILELKETTIDDFNFNPRPVQYKDISILMRSTTAFLTFKKVFDLYGIPNQMVLSQGFLKANEVENMLYVLKAIQDPYQDAYLLSVLRAPYLFSAFKDDEIASLRKKDREKSFYQLLLESEDEKHQHFIQVFHDLIEKSKTMTFASLMNEIYEVTGYLNFVGGLINGAQRVANLMLLLNKIEEKQSHYFSLRHLIDDFDQMSDISIASIPSKNEDTVTFMTIHKSKGLEFPIVFVANTQKSFNMSDATEKMMMDKQLGMSLKCRQRETIKEGDTSYSFISEYQHAYHRLIALKQRKMTCDEEMRIFYVALTRASQKLILTGIMDPERLDHWVERAYNQHLNVKNDPVLYSHHSRMYTNYLDLVGIALVRHPDMIEVLRNLEVDVDLKLRLNGKISAMKPLEINLDNVSCAQFTMRMYQKEELQPLLRKMQEVQENPHLVDEMMQAKHQTILLEERVESVTDLQKEVSEHYFMDHSYSSDELTPTQRGTLVHAFLEYLPLEKEVNVEAYLESYPCLEEERTILYHYKDSFKAFVQSDCFKEMLEANVVLKEEFFNFYDQERDSMIHGIFDVVCVYDDHLTIIDYKTDRLSKHSSLEQLVKLHEVQMNYYKKILGTLYPSKKVEAWVYYLHLNRYVKV